jgi:hypothetical protein
MTRQIKKCEREGATRAKEDAPLSLTLNIQRHNIRRTILFEGVNQETNVQL